MEAVYPTDSRRPLGRALCFVFCLYVSWVGAWILERALEHGSNWMGTSGGRFAYWTVMKLLLWVIPATVLLRSSGHRLRDILGLGHTRSILIWGGGIGLLFAAGALITNAVTHRPLFAPQLGWPLLGGAIVAPIVEEFTFRGAILQTLLARYRFLVANTLTALFFVGIHLPGWYFQGRLSAMLALPIGGALSILFIGWVLGLVACKSKSVAASTLTHILNNLFSAF
jgi:membrane protease YdiL (CAAX protease family)